MCSATYLITIRWTRPGPTAVIVGAERQREAVDKVTRHQFDRHGKRVWHGYWRASLTWLWRGELLAAEPGAGAVVHGHAGERVSAGEGPSE